MPPCSVADNFRLRINFGKHQRILLHDKSTGMRCDLQGVSDITGDVQLWSFHSRHND
jgi:hypothetical protein